MSHMVWMTSTRSTRFHATATCWRVRNGRTGGEMKPVDLASVHRQLPCSACYPSAPRVKVWHPLCLICPHVRPTPCPHNGAVLARVPRYGQWTGKFGVGEFDPDKIEFNERWVWPENAWRYDLVNSTLIT